MSPRPSRTQPNTIPTSKEVTMKQQDETQLDCADALLRRHETAANDYLVRKERLITLSQRLEKYRKTADAARADAETAGKAWRERLRANDGEIDKELLRLKKQVGDSQELADEYQAMVTEVQAEYELSQLEAHDLRSRYLSARGEAATAYGTRRREETAAALFATPEGQAFFSELARSGYFREPEESCRAIQQVANGDQQAKRLLAELKRLMSLSGFDAHQAAEDNDTWASLRVEPLSDAEEIQDPQLRASRAARLAKQRELKAQQQTPSA